MKDVHECVSCEKGILQKPFLYTRHISCHALNFEGILRLCEIDFSPDFFSLGMNAKSPRNVILFIQGLKP